MQPRPRVRAPASLVAVPLLLGCVIGLLNAGSPQPYLPLAAAAASLLLFAAVLIVTTAYLKVADPARGARE